MRRRTILKGSAASLAVISGATVLPAPAIGGNRLTTYVVTDEPGSTPEGIAITGAGTMYVTSVGTGAVYRGNVHTARLQPFLPAGSDGRTAAAGIHVDQQGRIFVAGASSSALYVHDSTGQLLAKRSATAGSFLNDCVITRDAVYVTDTAHHSIWRAVISDGSIGPLEPWLAEDRFPLLPRFINGIVATPDERLLLVADQWYDVTWRIETATGSISQLEVADGVAFSGDGLLLEGHRLYGVWMRWDDTGKTYYRVRQLVTDHDYRHARLVADSPEAPDGATPTTIARDRDRLLWVNSQLDIAPGTPPYTVTEVPGVR